MHWRASGVAPRDWTRHRPALAASCQSDGPCLGCWSLIGKTLGTLSWLAHTARALRS